MIDALELEAEIEGITSLSPADAAAVVKMAQVDPVGAAQLLLDYEASAAPGTPNFVEKAWAALQIGLGIAMPLANAVVTAAGVPPAIKAL